MNSSMKIAAMFVLSSPLAMAGCLAEQAGDEAAQSVAQAEQAGGAQEGAVKVTEVGPGHGAMPGGEGIGCVAPCPVAPEYLAPTVQAPSYPAPSYGAPRHGAPVYHAPVYQSPTYQSPSETPCFNAPSYSAPSYPGPTYNAPVYESPTYGAPTFLAPIFEGPTYAPENVLLPANPLACASIHSIGQACDNP